MRESQPGTLSAVEALSTVFTGWERGDNDAIADVFAPDGVLEDPLKQGPIHGREQIRAQNQPAVEALEECAITITHMFEQGDLGFCEGYFAARIAATGGRLDFPFAAVVEMRDGQVARLSEYYDTGPLAT